MDFKERTKLKIAISKMKEEEKAMSKNNNFIIKKGIGIAACFVILFSGIVYAKDIEQFIRSLFNNSTEAIDKAVENGYVQKEKMDFVYDKDIGVRVDNLVIDDFNLAISFNFETKKEDIKSIRFKNFIITNDNEKVVYRSEFKTAETPDEIPLYNSLTWNNMPERVSDTIFSDSILFGLRPETEEFKKLFFDIKSLNITYPDNRIEEIEGNWKFDIEISEKMRNSGKVEYSLLESNEYVESATATLSPIGMIVELNLKEINDPRELMNKADRGELTTEDLEGYILKYNNKAISPSNRDGGGMKNSEGKIDVTVRYDSIGFFTDNIEKFEIYIVAFDTTITFVRENL